MTRLLLAGAAALGMMSGAAMAQSSGYSSGHSSSTVETTTVTPGVSAPWTTSGSMSTGRGATADGDQTAMSSSTSSDSAGNKTTTTITNTSFPLTNMIMTTKKTVSIAGGVATETVTTTQTYPPSAQVPPVVSTSTRSYVVGSK
jgi:hypothetical protein